MEIRRGFVDSGLFNIKIKRLAVYTHILTVYKENMNITGLELRVKFDGEAGVDGGGLTRELFPVFWKSVENKLCEGLSIKVPMITPEYASHFFHLGRILSHGFVLTGFLPICLASSFLCHLLSPDFEIDDDLLMNDFCLYIDPFERDSIMKCLSGKEDEDTDRMMNDVIIPMVSRFNCHQSPTLRTLKESMITVAHYTFLCQPHYALAEMKRGMITAHPELWKYTGSHIPKELLAMLTPTRKHVISMIIEPEFRNSAQQQTFDLSINCHRKILVNFYSLFQEHHSVLCRIFLLCSTLLQTHFVDDQWPAHVPWY